MTIYRVQSVLDGRGPWRPGFSNLWVDHSRTKEQWSKLIAWQDQFVKRTVLRKARKQHVGCGCRTPEQLKLWFTEGEYTYLLTLGYQAVAFNDARLLAESDVQCIFARKKPLTQDLLLFRLY